MVKWIGDKKQGLELRFHDELHKNGLEILDEMLLWIDGKCIMHMESTSMANYWFGFYLEEHEVHMNIGSRNFQAHIIATAEEQ